MSNSKNITLENLTRYDTKIKEYIANQGGATWDTTTGKPFEALDPNTFSVSSDGVLKVMSLEITIDSELSDSSENPVQNKVVTSALQDKVDNTQIVTSTSNGLMTSTDKAKLDGIDEGANKYTHPTYTARTGVPTANQSPSFGGTFSVTQPVSDTTGHITAMTSRTITIPSTVASTSSSGLISTTAQTFAGDKTFNGQVIPAGASDVGTAQARKIYAGTEDLTAGTSELETGAIYLVYE